MRSSLQPVSSSRSLALQQYDEAKTLGTRAGTCSSTAAAARSRVAASASTRIVLQQDHDDDWGLCGWQEGPSVPHEARVASAKLSKHQPAQPPAQQQPSTIQAPSNSSDRTSSGGSRRSTPAGKGSSPSRRPAQGSPAQRSRPPQQQQQHPAAGKLPLADWAPFGAHDAAPQNCRPHAVADIAPTETAGTPVGAGAAAAAGTAAGACGSTLGSSSRATSAGSNQSSISSSTSSGCSGSTTTSSSAWHLPSIQHNYQQQACQLAAHGATSFSTLVQAEEACIGSAAATGSEQPTADAANWDDCGEPLDHHDALFGPCGSGSRGAVGWQLPSTALGSSNSNILALQQRLLLPACASSLARTSSSSSGGGLLAASRQSAAGVTAQPAAGPRISASGSMGVLVRGAGTTALQAAPAAPGFCLHTRMATTAARAQLLLTRDLSTMLTPHAPRVRPGSGQTGAASSAAAAADDSREREQQPWEQQPPPPQQQQLGGSVNAVPTLRFVSSSRPSSASRCGRGAAAAAAAAAASAPTYAATSAPGVPGCVFSGSGLQTAAGPSAGADRTLYSPQACTASTTTSSSGDGGGSSGCSGSGSVAGSRPASGLRRPVSASVRGAMRWGSRTGSDSGLVGSSSRPGSTGVPVLGTSTAGAGVGTPQSKGLSAAADYMACRATVGELLQRINSQKAAASAAVEQLARTVITPPKAASPGATRAVTPTAASAGFAGHDTVFSRDSRMAGSPQVTCRTSDKGVTSSQLLGLRTQPGLSAVERCTSLKAYQAFQSGTAAQQAGSSVHGSSSGSNGSGIWPCLHKSISSGPSIRAGASTATLELRATAALRKCGSTKQ